MIREINVLEIKKAVAKLCITANNTLPPDIECTINKFKEQESSPLAKDILNHMQDNISLAKKLKIPICQDTGMAVLFVSIGQDVHITGGNLTKAINEGVANGYTDGLLRMSIVSDPLNRVNTNNNTPCVIHYDIISGNKIEIIFMPKGFGSENMSRIVMLEPSCGRNDVINWVLDTVKKAGSNPCPPIIIGVGIGGNFESCAILAKKALTLDITTKNSDPYYALLEEEILNKVNKLNIGPQGFKGKTTALSVKICPAATHIAGLPLAVNIGCHVTRHESIVI